MTAPFTPIRGRVLLEPLESDKPTESGLILVEDRKPETMGRVVAVAESPFAAVRAEVAERLASSSSPERIDAYESVLDLLPAEVHEVTVGDVVLFSWASGQEIRLDDARYLIMPESDILAVVEDA